eukprot:10887-Pyramimonas_sp.AAC.1
MAEAIRSCPDEEELLRQISDCPGLLLEDEEVRRDSVRLYFRRARGPCASCGIPPPTEDVGRRSLGHGCSSGAAL